VSKLAVALASLAKRIWAAAAARLAKGWELLQRAASAALNAAKAVVAKVGAAIRTLKDILKILRSNMLEKLFEAVKDPEGKIVPVIIAKADPLVGQVPGKAQELGLEKAKEVG